MVFKHFLERAVVVALLLVASLMAGAAQAASPAVDAKLAVARIEFNGTTETVTPADRARPGDVLEYATRFANRGDAAARGFMPTMPVPIGTDYVPGGSTVAPTHASLDGVTMLAIPLHRTVKGPDGKARVVEIPASEYRALRWTLGTLDPGQEVTVRARVRISPPAAVATREALPSGARSN